MNNIVTLKDLTLDQRKHYLFWQQVQECIERLDVVLSTNIFDAPDNPLQHAAFTEITVCLNDLLQKLNEKERRISFTDDLIDQSKDITDTVCIVRNAICHLTSASAFNEFGVSSRFNILRSTSKTSITLMIGDAPMLQMKCDYDDDIAFFVGTHRLYLRRHIKRALDEAKLSLAQINRNDQTR